MMIQDRISKQTYEMLMRLRETLPVHNPKPLKFPMYRANGTKVVRIA